MDGVRKQDVFWPGDRHLDCPSGPCAEIWEIRDTPAGEVVKVATITVKPDHHVTVRVDAQQKQAQ